MKIRRGADNMLGVDAQRISDFGGSNQEIPGTMLKVIIAVAFLVNLIGWWAVLAGLMDPFVFQPLYSMAAGHYHSERSAVMVARYKETHVVNEALQGTPIQILYS